MNLTLRLVGAPAILNPAGKVSPLGAKEAALMAMLALDAKVPEDRAMSWIWPDSVDPRNNLRQRLYTLRAASAGDAIVRQRSVLALGAGWTIDCMSAHIEELDGEFLGEADYTSVSAELSLWVDAKRLWYRNTWRSALVASAEQHLQHGGCQEVHGIANRLIATCPLDDVGYRLALRAHYKAGDRTAAIGAYDRLAAMLHKHHSVELDASDASLRAAIDSMDMGSTPNRLPSVPAALLRPPRLIGRERQIRRLQSALGANRHVVVVGEAGAGKTRLVESFTGHGSDWIACRACVGDTSSPYSSVARLLSLLLGRCSDPQRLSMQERAVLRRLDVQGLGDEPAGGTLTPGRVLAAALSAFHAVDSDVPRRLWLDDLHFADRPSSELLRLMLPQLRELRWLCVIAQRPEGVGADLAWVGGLAEQGLAELIELNPLSENEVSELVQSLALDGHSAVLDAVILHRRCGGNPFFLLETLRSWLESKEANDASMPRAATVDVLLDDRLRRLDQDSLALAQAALVAGTEINMELAEAVLGRKALELSASWLVLEHAGVWKGNGFAHDLVRDAVSRSIAGPWRASLAGRIANWLHRNQGNPERLASLWRQAGRWREAARESEASAHRAKQLGRLAEQIAFLDDAAEAWRQIDDWEQVCRVLVCQFPALLELARLSRVHEIAAIITKDKRASAADRVHAMAAVAEAQFHELGDERALSSMLEARDLAGALGERAIECRMLGYAAYTLCWLNRPVEGLTLIEAPAKRAIKRRSEPQASEYALWYADVLFRNSRLAEAKTALAFAREQAPPDAGLTWRADAMFLDSELSYWTADVARSVVCLERLRILRLEGEGEPNGVAPEDGTLGERLAQIGRFSDALRFGQQAVSAFEQAEDPWRLSAAVASLALTWVRLGQPERAFELLVAMPDAATSDPRLLMRWEFTKALALEVAQRNAVPAFERALGHATHSDRPEAARCFIESSMSFHLPARAALEVSQRLWDQCRTSEELLTILRVRLSLMDAMRRLGKRREAGDHARELLAICTKQGPSSAATGRTWWLLHEALLDAGERRAATTALKRGREWLQSAAGTVPIEFRNAFLVRPVAHRNLGP